MLRDLNTEQLSESATHLVERLEDVSFDEVVAERKEHIYIYRVKPARTDVALSERTDMSI